jgi:hypothetical protein
MVKVTGPVMSLTSSIPLRKKRVPYGAAPLPPQPEQILVTAGDPPPVPDCTGTYIRIADFNDEHAYQRTTEPVFYIFWDSPGEVWIISLQLLNSPEDGWYKLLSQSGPYDSTIYDYTGIPIASEPFIP